MGFLDKSNLPVIRFGNGIQDGRKTIVEYSPRRVSLEIAGRIMSPSERAQPLVCKNKLCVNPAHLIIGDEARFWVKVQRLGEDDCWVWTASQDKDLYGRFRISENGKNIDIRAHQYSWQLHSGRPIPSGVQVCHHCDHPYCVNPKHLFLGTTQDNTKDRDEKGRQIQGESHHKSKLDIEKVKKIRELYASGTYTQQQLADQFEISRSVIYDIVTHRTWKSAL